LSLKAMAEAAKTEKTKEEKAIEKAEKEQEDEEKEKKAEAKAKGKFLDEEDENFCGYMSLMIVDQDGYKKTTKGMEIKGPMYMTSDGKTGDPVVLEAEFALNPLFYIAVPNEESLLMFGQWWIGEKASTLTTIGSAIPKSTQVAHKDMEKSATTEFSMDVEMPLLKGAPSRLVRATITTKEQKFVTKVVKAKLEVPRASWLEWKQHRNKFRNFGKNQGGGGAGAEGGGGEKGEEKKE